MLATYLAALYYSFVHFDSLSENLSHFLFLVNDRGLK
jgi:hypothetical protein